MEIRAVMATFGSAEEALEDIVGAGRDSDIPLNRKWMDESVAMLRPVTQGHYINEIDPVHYPQHVAECFSKESWKRLATLRKQYDPQGLFFTWLGQEEVTS